MRATAPTPSSASTSPSRRPPRPPLRRARQQAATALPPAEAPARAETPASAKAPACPAPGAPHLVADGPHLVADVRDAGTLRQIVAAYDVDTIYHLASLLSASGERAPERAWDVNMHGLKHVLDLARDRRAAGGDLRVFWPSSIAVFGPATPKEAAPQRTVFDPTTMYGVTKRAGELLARYYHRRYGVDVRSLRYPGLLSYAAPPGGGTTDYAVAMCAAAARAAPYACFVRPDTRLPMMYMPDALDATLGLMDADAQALTVRTSYNVTALSFSAAALADALAARVPGFRVTYAPDERQQIADAWPASIDDAVARADWGWQPAYDLDATLDDMLAHLAEPASAQPANAQPANAKPADA